MTALSPAHLVTPATAAARPMAPSAPATTSTLPLRARASVGVSLNGWALPIAGAVVGGLLMGLPGALVGGVLGYLLLR